MQCFGESLQTIKPGYYSQLEEEEERGEEGGEEQEDEERVVETVTMTPIMVLHEISKEKESMAYPVRRQTPSRAS